MDLENYISSGIIDAYVLGHVSDQERREVECMSKIYPEIMDELRNAQLSLEMVAKSNAVNPPSNLKDQILSKIKSVEQDEPGSKGKIIALDSSVNQQKGLPIFRIAAILVIAVLSGLFIYQLRQSNKLTTEVQLAEEENLNSQKQLEELNLQIAELRGDNDIIISPSTAQIKLAGTDFQPSAQVRIFYNNDLKEVVMISDQLEEPGDLNQYQLWAIADGVPVDLGVITKGIEKEKFPIDLEHVDAFAITLEKNGGVESPTLENMVVIGTTAA